MHANLRSFLSQLRKENELVEIAAPVDPYLEIAEIHRRVIAEGGPALLFTNVKNSAFPVVTNLFGTYRRVEMAVGKRPETIVRQAVEALDRLFPPKPASLWRERGWIREIAFKTGLRTVSSRRAPVLEAGMEKPDMTKLPALTTWPEDGGPFVTLPLVYTEHPVSRAHNLGMYRMQIFSPDLTGMHWQIHKGGGFHHYEAELRNESLPVTVFLGGPPALILSAIAPVPEMLPELILASFMMGGKLNRTTVSGHPHPLIAEAEFAFCGEVPPHVRKQEGPFGDHYGYYSLAHDFPVFRVKRVYHRKDAIYPATIVGKPRQEDYYIAEYLVNLLSPVFPVVMPGVKELWAYPESGAHALASARVRESYYREAVAHGFRILGEGQLTLTKFLILTDAPCDLRNFAQLMETVAARFQPHRDLLIIDDTSMDTLDYTGRAFNKGSKGILAGVGEPVREPKRVYDGGPIPGIGKIRPYCGGCLVVSGASFAADEELAARLVKSGREQLKDWQFVFLVDDADEIRDQMSFIWTVFTRFNPAHDVYAEAEIKYNKIRYRGPIIVDCRMKPWYPATVEPREDTVKLVDERWKEYFMG